MTSLPPRGGPLNKPSRVNHKGPRSLVRFEEAMRIITGKWKGDISWLLSPGKRRFGELMRGMPTIATWNTTAWWPE